MKPFKLLNGWQWAGIVVLVLAIAFSAFELSMHGNSQISNNMACSDWSGQNDAVASGKIANDSQLLELVQADVTSSTGDLHNAFASLASAITAEDDNSIATYTMYLDSYCGV